VKANKINNGDSETATSKIYGNAYLGPNLWDKNDLFQGGVKFEHLEIDEFLNENGLNQTDVEFLDQIQKIDAFTGSSNLSTTYGNSNNNFINSSINIGKKLSATSPPLSSISSVSVSELLNNDQPTLAQQTRSLEHNSSKSLNCNQHPTLSILINPETKNSSKSQVDSSQKCTSTSKSIQSIPQTSNCSKNVANMEEHLGKERRSNGNNYYCIY